MKLCLSEFGHFEGEKLKNVDLVILKEERKNVGLINKVGIFWLLVPFVATQTSTANETKNKFCVKLVSKAGSGWTGTMTHTLTFDSANDIVHFDAEIKSTSKNRFLTKSYEAMNSSIASNVRSIAKRHVELIKARSLQKEAFSKSIKEMNGEKKRRIRDRILHPEKYERKHVRMDESEASRAVRWGDARRKQDFELR
eukprot:CAMPEP_0171460264 /NCGR_PEP_ID=MMETSP0945-20130129/5199_1 /TAXON_ID=109269 /ORGANISM="Vaucheria litorea, Strain CCMP2940" /LENGTH=196 /DNA_ID=CAMNT_0011986411 /DNA_START=245 /DNA_END=832 /DNA_ORIENTATION=-